jgi:hypothetical protein
MYMVGKHKIYYLSEPYMKPSQIYIKLYITMEIALMDWCYGRAASYFFNLQNDKAARGLCL